MNGAKPSLSAGRRAVVALCFLICTASAILTVDVGAGAMNNVWRPNSCADVSDGVLLTNVTDNVRVVIEGCTIAVDAGPNISTSAVSIEGLGANSSVELRSCDVTVDFATAAETAVSNRHAAVHVLSNAHLADGSTLSILNTTVTMTDTGQGYYGSAVLLDTHITTGLGFQLKIVESSVHAKCEYYCAGVLGLGRLSTLRAGAVFGPRTQLLILNTTMTKVAQVSGAFNMHLFEGITLGNNTAVVFKRCSVSASAPVYVRNIIFHRGMAFGSNSALTVTTSSVLTAAAQNSGAASIQLVNDVTFGDNSAVSVIKATTLIARAVSQSYGLAIVNNVFGVNGTVEIAQSHLALSGRTECGALLLWAPVISSVNVHVSYSALQFNGSATDGPLLHTGAIVSHGAGAWQDVALSVEHTSFIATDLRNITDVGNNNTTDGAAFMRWPRTITGVSPQMFEDVVMSIPAGTETALSPFRIAPGGA